MGNVEEMAGIGMDIEHAKAIVGSKNVATATGSTAADAALLPTSGVVTVSGADGTKGVIVDARLPMDSTQIIVNASGAGLLKVYPPTGESISGLPANTAIEVAANAAVEIGRY